MKTKGILDVMWERSKEFKPIHKNAAIKYSYESLKEAFILCNSIRVETEVPEYTWEKFIEGHNYRNIFNEKWKIARDEFINLVFGWW
jgi:hypothetical protein